MSFTVSSPQEVPRLKGYLVLPMFLLGLLPVQTLLHLLAQVPARLTGDNRVRVQPPNLTYIQHDLDLFTSLWQNSPLTVIATTIPLHDANSRSRTATTSTW